MRDAVRWGTIGAGAAIMLGSFLPWGQAGIFTVSGTDGDGIFTLVLGGVLVGIGIANKPSRGLGIVAILMSVLSGLIAWNIVTSMGDAAGSGLYLVLLGAVFGVISGLGVYADEKVEA